MSKVVTNATADKLKALLAREAGRLTSSPPASTPEPPKVNWQFVRVTDVGFVGDDGFTYYPGQVEIWVSGTSEEVICGDCWVKNWNPDELFLDRVYICRQSGNMTPGNQGSGSGSGGLDSDLEFPLFLTADGFGDVDTSGSGSGSGGGDCETTNEVTFRECDPTTGEQTDVTITFPGGVRVCRTPVASGG